MAENNIPDSLVNELAEILAAALVADVLSLPSGSTVVIKRHSRTAGTSYTA